MRLREYAALFKLRLTSLVVFSAVLGYFFGVEPGGFQWTEVLLLILGGTLVTGASNALNQVLEVEEDSLMKRTADRPLVREAITLTEAISGVSRQLTIVGGRQPITFNVPASIKDGAKLRLPATASRPEIIATVHITNPYGFDRKEDNLIVDVSVPFTTCAMGGEITAVTPSGERKTLRLPAGTQGGQQLRITGHGMTKGAGNPRGDMLVRIKIEVPKNLTDRQRAALDELAAALEDSK